LRREYPDANAGHAISAEPVTTALFSTTGRTARFQKTLLTGQVAFSLVSLIAASLFLRAVQRAYDIDPGYDYQHLAVLMMNPEQQDHDVVRLKAFHRQVEDRVSRIPDVQAVIQDKLTGQRPSINAVSQDLHMGPRTLQRRLQDSGSSFQRVLDEARHQMARYYLSNSALELNEAAYLLGFEDPNSFGRAFRNWEGMPPSDWRETHRPTKVM
jgi:AraC-like DNA-binding protein